MNIVFENVECFYRLFHMFILKSMIEIKSMLAYFAYGSIAIFNRLHSLIFRKDRNISPKQWQQTVTVHRYQTKPAAIVFNIVVKYCNRFHRITETKTKTSTQKQQNTAQNRSTLPIIWSLKNVCMKSVQSLISTKENYKKKNKRKKKAETENWAHHLTEMWINIFTKL